MTGGTQHQMHESDLGKDANVLIMELNKGLQSPNLGEQCKAIAQFPNLLEKYPFPMVVNSIFLKITQIFCDGSNYLRLCVLRACTECRAQLEKLTICDDIVRKLMPFTCSNDPAARALTLRLFGTLSRITSEHIGVHHAILKQINSHYEVESDAAIWSSHQLASVSSAFAVSLCPILCKLLNEMSSDWDVKLKLLRLGKHMHHDVQVVEQMRSCLVSMLTAYSSLEFVLCILDTLTLLTTRAPIHTEQQLDLLLHYLAEDKRPRVRQCSLYNLSVLAKHVPHQWDRPHLQKLCELINLPNQQSSELEDIVRVFYDLADTDQAVDLLKACSQDRDWGFVPCLRNTLLIFPTTRVTVKVIQLVCKLLVLFASTDSTGTDNSSYGLELSEFVPLVVMHFLIPSGNPDRPVPWYLSSDELSEDEIKLTYSLLVQLFCCFPSYASCVHEMKLWNLITLDGGPLVGLLCQFLNTLTTHLPNQNNPIPVEVLLERLGATNSNLSKVDQSHIDSGSILAICGLIFQLTNDRFLNAAESRSLLAAIATQTDRSKSHDRSEPQSTSPVRFSTWLAYRVARQASRYGQHLLAANIYELLCAQALSERSNYWIQGLIELSKTEAAVISVARRLSCDPSPIKAIEHVVDPSRRPAPCPWVLDLIDALHGACDSALQSRTTLICVGGPDTRWFPAEYVGLRADLFSNLAELCSSAYHHSRVSRWPGQTSQNVSEGEQSVCTPFWLLDQLEMWNTLAERLATFQAQCLDADQTTHDHLSALSTVIGFFIRTMNAIVSRFENPSQGGISHDCVPIPVRSPEAPSSSNSDPFARILPNMEKVARAQLDFQPRAFANFDWIPSLVLMLVRTSPHWPRFFFQRLQTTTVRLVLLPKAGNNPDDVLTISSEIGHMIQVMGVIQQHSRRDPDTVSHRISLVEVELTVTELPSSGHHTRTSLIHNTTATLDQDQQAVVFYSRRSAPLQRDYFHCEFCVHFPGHTQSKVKNGTVATDKLYAIRASAVLVDHTGLRWRLTRVSGAPEEINLVRVECVKSGTVTTISNGSVTSGSESAEPLQQSATRSNTSGSTKVDIGRVALDSQFSLTKPRPIGRPVGESTSTSGVKSTVGSRNGSVPFP